MKLTHDQLKRFLNFIVFAGDGECWLWSGSTNGGRYGKFSLIVNGKKTSQSAHRLMYQIINKVELKSDQYVCHSCDVPRCCNPTHLFLGDAKTNQQDCKNKGRTLVGEKHPRSTLSEKLGHKIIDLRLKNKSTTYIAKKLNLTATTVANFLSGKRWHSKSTDKRLELLKNDLKEISKQQKIYGLSCGWNKI